jgi:HK97 family phage major capsid protein
MFHVKKKSQIGTTPAASDAAPAAPAAAPAAPAAAAQPAKPAVVDEAGLAAIVARAVSGALDAMGMGPAVHTGQGHDTKDYLDDAAREHVGDDRMKVRRENERRSALEDLRGPTALRREQRPEPTRAGFGIAEYIGWMAVAGGDCERAWRMAKKHGGSKLVVRALGESTFSAGGAFVPENMAADYIELLYNTSVFLAAGPTRMSIANGNLTLPKLTGGATPTWIGESDNVANSQQTTGQVRIDLKKLAVLTAASNEFLRDAGPAAIAMIRDDIARAAGVAVDAVALRGLGTVYQPKGLRGWVPAANQFASGGVTVPLITTDLTKMFRLIEEGKIISTMLSFFSSPRTKWGLMAARDGNNNEVWAPELRQGTLYGAKFASTQNIPNNVGTGGNKSELYLAAMEHLIFAEEPAGVRVDVSDGAAYHDGSGVVAGFSKDETAVRLVQRCDIVDRQNGAGIVQLFDVAIA